MRSVGIVILFTKQQESISAEQIVTVWCLKFLHLLCFSTLKFNYLTTDANKLKLKKTI